MDETADLAGVGLGLVSEVVSGRPSALNVNAIEPSGAAAKSGLIMLGDTLCEVDDRDVSSMLPNQVKGLVMGVPGSSITLGLKRGSGHPFYVRLTRSHPVPSSRVSDASAGNWPAVPLQASTDAASAQQSVDKHPTAPPPSVEQGGIGVGIALDTSGQLRVTSLTPGGPADRSELIKIGDILRSVDSHNIAGRSAAAVKPYIIGPVGSPLTLVVIRGRTPITVRLLRSRAQSAAPATAAPQQQQQQQQQQQPDSMIVKNAPLPTATRAVEPPIAAPAQAVVVNLAEKAREIMAKKEAELLQIQQQQQLQQLQLQQQQQQAQQQQSGENNASVGLLLAPRSDGKFPYPHSSPPRIPTTHTQPCSGRLEIAGMSEGGAAQRSNMFKKGDVLTHVNGTDVQRLKIHQVHICPSACAPPRNVQPSNLRPFPLSQTN
jgi:C-terminal processing protease CtpA/Prc